MIQLDPHWVAHSVLGFACFWIFWLYVAASARAYSASEKAQRFESNYEIVLLGKAQLAQQLEQCGRIRVINSGPHKGRQFRLADGITSFEIPIDLNSDTASIAEYVEDERDRSGFVCYAIRQHYAAPADDSESA